MVDLDAAVTTLSRTMPAIAELNAGALDDARVTVVNADARAWLRTAGDLFDVVVIDLPDPSSEDVARLYTTGFYRSVARRLSAGGTAAPASIRPAPRGKDLVREVT